MKAILGLIAVAAGMSLVAGERACACGPDGAGSGSKGFTAGNAAFAGKGMGGMAFGGAPMMGGGMDAALAGQKQLLAQQAAARQAQRRDVKLAKAYQARQEMLAERAANRESIAQRYQEYRRRKGLDAPADSQAPLLANVAGETTR